MSAPATHVEQSAKGKSSAGKLALGAMAALLVVLIAVAALIYSSEESSLADLRQANGTLSTQLAQSRQETQASQTSLAGVQEQLSRSQAEATEARANGQALSDQLAQSNQKVQQTEASVKDLQAANSDANGRLAQAQKSAQDYQAKGVVLTQKVTKAMARAQLIDQYINIAFSTASGDAKTAMTLTWFNNLAAIGDPTIDGYLAAFFKNPKDTTSLNKLVVYLSGSVTAELR